MGVRSRVVFGSGVVVRVDVMVWSSERVVYGLLGGGCGWGAFS